MSNYIIKVENLGKKYKIRHQPEQQCYVALRDVIASGVKGVGSKVLETGRHLLSRNGVSFTQDLAPHASRLTPDATVSSTLSSPRSQLQAQSSVLPAPGSLLKASGPLTSDLRPLASEDFWALKGVSFEVKQGEVVGIIGRNGAGKSTLLKILSRITKPTEGRVHIRGRVASLLEVGTGFHPELTGRENIFLNGAVLGMSRAEIKGKFEEIVSFAEVEKFLDTPVKRYSSGMYVRLAFAVAAHLEPEIFLVDEVLAVGDTEFQKKCLGKMSDIARGGRTVLFVSHNMAAVKSLTTLGIVVQAGQVTFTGRSAEAIDFYTCSINSSGENAVRELGAGTHTAIRRARLLNKKGEQVIHYTPGAPLILELTFTTDGAASLSLEVFLLDSSQSKLGLASLYQFQGINLPNQPGTYVCCLSFEPLWLASGAYALDVTTSLVNHGWDHYVEGAISFDVITSNPLGHSWNFKYAYGYGSFALLCAESPHFRRLEQ